MKRISRRWLRVAAVAALAVLVVGVAVAFVGNDFRITEERVRIAVADRELDAVVARPERVPTRGIVVLVHGDGPVDATHDGLYRSWWEAAGDAGYATISWSKAGVGESTGDWLAQTMTDRAAEASAVIDWARSRPDLPHEVIGLWGSSQAGWVLPKVVQMRPDVAFVVAVSPAVNWLRQGRYNLLAELDRDRRSSADREDAIADSDRTRRLLDGGSDYAAYRATTTDAEPMSAQRWEFVRRNYRSDATADLAAMSARGIPVLLMLGRHDRNVDTTETAEVYTRLLGPHVRVVWIDATHSMARPVVEDRGWLGLATGILWPRALFAPGVFAAYQAFLGNS